jgi:hypothetical protein
VLPVPNDEAFVHFVNELSSAGASPQTIAGALNKSVWADPKGRRWHWRQVSAILATPGARPEAPVVISTSDHEAPPQPDRLSARRLAVLRAIHDWRPFDQWNVDTIWARHQDGESLTAIANRMNRSGTTAPNGRPWTRFWVSVMLHMRAVAMAGACDQDTAYALSA